MNATPSPMHQAISRRRVFEILGIGVAGAAGLAACAKGGDGDPAKGNKGGGGGGGGGTAEFHAGWPYVLPPVGHFNLFTGMTNRIDVGAYFDLIVAPGGMWYWADKKWEYLICESFTFNEKEFVYNVRKGLTWNDGSPITAKDVETTFWCRWVMRQTEWPYIQKLETTDDHTVKFTLKDPASVMERYIIRAQIFADKTYGSFAKRAKALFESGKTMDDPEGTKINEELQAWRPKDNEKEVLTSGPFRYDFKQISNAQLTLNKNDKGLLAKQVKFDKIVVFKGETEDITPLVLNKTVDYATHGFPLATQKSFEAKGFRVLKPAVYSGPALIFSFDKVPMFKDVRVRQALAHAINRGETGAISLADSAKDPVSMAGFSEIQVPDWVAEADKPKLDKYEYDVAKATTLLTQAGWKKSGDKWTLPDGKPAKFTLMFPSDFADWAPAGKNVAEQLTKFGIDIQQNGIESKDIGERILKGNFQLALQGWGAGTPHPYFAFNAAFIDRNYPVAANQGGKGIAFDLKQNTKVAGKVDIQQLILDSGEGLDEAAQKAKISQLALIFNELLPIIPIFERYGNNAALEGVRVKAWPADGDPIYENGPYNDNHAIMLMYTGKLEPVGK